MLSQGLGNLPGNLLASLQFKLHSFMSTYVGMGDRLCSHDSIKCPAAMISILSTWVGWHLQEARIRSEIAGIEKDTGFRLRVLAQNYPETPGSWVLLMSEDDRHDAGSCSPASRKCTDAVSSLNCCVAGPTAVHPCTLQAWL